MSDGQDEGWRERRLAGQRQGILNQFGQKVLNQVDAATYQITDVLMMQLQFIEREGGNSEQFLEVIWDFSQALAKRLGSANLRSDSVTTALAGATALMAPEETQKYQEDAKRMVDALTKRYGSFTE